MAGRILDRDGPGPCTHARMPESQSSTCSTRVRPGAQLLSIILFGLDLGVMADQPSGSAEAQPDPGTIPNLKAILKESLVEILRETPSLLQPPTDAQQGKCSARDVAGSSCVVSVARCL